MFFGTVPRPIHGEKLIYWTKRRAQFNTDVFLSFFCIQRVRPLPKTRVSAHRTMVHRSNNSENGAGHIQGRSRYER